MLVIALTGSIGMGKSTTARMFAEAGVPVHDADAVVHRLYQGAAAAPIEASFPGTTRDGAVDREALAKAVVGQPDALRRLEAIVHPLVRAEERLFRTTMRGHRAVLLDIPLLFESGSEVRADLVVVVTAPAAVQRARVLSRPGMSAARFESLLARQMSDAEKRRRAHALIDTSRGLDAARRSVAAILRASAPMAGRHGLNQNG